MRVDAHHHLWDPAAVDYGWLTDDVGVLQRAFLADELEPQLRRAGIDATVLVQAANSLEDTEWMLRVAAETPWIAGVVGWVPLTGRDETVAALDRIDHPKLVGVRHLLDGEASDWALGDGLDGLDVLAERGLVLDYPALFPLHLEALPGLGGRRPALTVVLDHLGSPEIGTDPYEAWAPQLAALADCPNVVAKLSGLAPGVGSPDWSAADLQPYVDHAFAVFGADRLMWGSDWPVCLLADDYATVHGEMLRTLDGRSAAERDAVLGGTAARVYGLRAEAA